jgi:hypothetical protein
MKYVLSAWLFIQIWTCLPLLNANEHMWMKMETNEHNFVKSVHHMFCTGCASCIRFLLFSNNFNNSLDILQSIIIITTQCFYAVYLNDVTKQGDYICYFKNNIFIQGKQLIKFCYVCFQISVTTFSIILLLKVYANNLYSC